MLVLTCPDSYSTDSYDSRTRPPRCTSYPTYYTMVHSTCAYCPPSTAHCPPPDPAASTGTHCRHPIGTNLMVAIFIHWTYLILRPPAMPLSLAAWPSLSGPQLLRAPRRRLFYSLHRWTGKVPYSIIHHLLEGPSPRRRLEAERPTYIQPCTRPSGSLCFSPLQESVCLHGAHGRSTK